MVVPPHNLSRPALLMGLEIQRLEPAEMHILNLGERVLNDLAGETRANTREQQERGLERKVRFNNRASVVVMVLVYAQGLRVEDAVTRPRAVVPCYEVVVPLALDGFECAEEYRRAEGVFAQAKRPAGEYALQANGAQLVAGVVPHGFVFPVEDVGGAEACLQCVKGRGDDGLEGACYEAGGECCRGGWGRVYALCLVGGGLVEVGEAVQIHSVQHGANAGICQQGWQDLVWYKGPALGAYSMGQHSGRRHSPAPASLGGDVGVDGTRIAHVVDPAAEEGLDGGAEVEGDHAGCYRSHAGRLHTSGRRLVRFLGFELIVAVAVEGYRQDSSASISTGAGCHCIVGR